MRDRILLIRKMLEEETDGFRRLSMGEIQRRLQSKGHCAERKTIYKDMAALNKSGFSAEFDSSANGWYHDVKIVKDNAWKVRMIYKSVESGRPLCFVESGQKYLVEPRCILFKNGSVTLEAAAYKTGDVIDFYINDLSDMKLFGAYAKDI